LIVGVVTEDDIVLFSFFNQLRERNCASASRIVLSSN